MTRSSPASSPPAFALLPSDISGHGRSSIAIVSVSGKWRILGRFLMAPHVQTHALWDGRARARLKTYPPFAVGFTSQHIKPVSLDAPLGAVLVGCSVGKTPSRPHHAVP